jgi:hypothetical protein
MEMIDVLKRLAELDAANPRVGKATLAQESSLLTTSNVEGESQLNESVEECGPMGMMGGAMPPHTPASLNITASSGPELSGMLKDLMSLAGVKPVDQEPAMMRHTGTDVAPTHDIVSHNDDMGKAISIIDSMNDEDAALEGQSEEERMYANSPEEEIEAHDYGDKQVKPKQQGLKQRIGDNPYKPTHEAVEQIANQLMRDYREFVNESQKKR